MIMNQQTSSDTHMVAGEPYMATYPANPAAFKLLDLFVEIYERALKIADIVYVRTKI